MPKQTEAEESAEEKQQEIDVFKHLVPEKIVTEIIDWETFLNVTFKHW